MLQRVQASSTHRLTCAMLTGQVACLHKRLWVCFDECTSMHRAGATSSGLRTAGALSTALSDIYGCPMQAGWQQSRVGWVQPAEQTCFPAGKGPKLPRLRLPCQRGQSRTGTSLHLPAGQLRCRPDGCWGGPGTQHQATQPDPSSLQPGGYTGPQQHSWQAQSPSWPEAWGPLLCHWPRHQLVRQRR